MTSDRRSGPGRRGLIITLAGAAALVFAGRSLAAAPRVGAPPPALVLKTLDGSELDLGHATGQVVIVNLWATWCTPCRAEMPMLNAFYLAHRDAGMTLVGVSADRSRDKADVKKAMRDFSYPAGLLSEARNAALDPPRILPMTYVIDRTGVVRAVFGGTGTPLTEAALAAAIQPLL